MRFFRHFFHYDNFISIIVLFVLYLLIFKSCSNDFIDPVSDAFSDVELTDIVYSQFDKNDNYRKVVNGELLTPDTNIVIVNIGNLDRKGIAQQIEILNKHEPHVIALDVFFPGASNPIQDFFMEEALANAKNVVFISRGINFDWQQFSFDSIQETYREFSKYGRLGYANLITNVGDFEEHPFKVCRRFIPQAIDKSTQKDHMSFAVAVCASYDEQKTRRFLERKNQVETINYTGNINYYNDKPRFRVIDVQDVLSGHFNSEWVRGKIVMLGFMGASLDERSLEDNFFTPLNAKYIGKAYPDMHGVVIHANIVSMILENNAVDEMPEWIVHILCLVILYILFASFRGVYSEARVWYDGFSKMLSLLVTVLLFFVIGVVFYSYDYKIVIPVGYYVAILLAGDYLEIYYGLLKNAYLLAKRKYL